MENQSLEQSVQVGIAEQIFTNASNMLVWCLTVIGLIKIYTRFEKITTLADNFVSIGFLVATVLSFAHLADLLFLASLTCTAAVAIS